MATKRQVKKNDASDVDTDEEVVEKDAKVAAKITKKKPAGYNYAAICIIAMMVLPALITLGITAYDMMYPEAAAARMNRDKVQRCYSAAKPKEVVDIDKIMKRYAGKETTLFATLRNKYSKFPECNMG